MRTRLGHILTIIAVGIIAVLAIGDAYAAPYLVCDPQDGVERYELYFDGAVTPTAAQPVDKAIRYDLANIAPGTHTVIAKACNAWGCSAASAPFTFSKIILGQPANVRLSE